MRRQGHSCDQCRRSKRACDALALEDSPDIESAFSAGSHRQAAPKTQPCSYCVRTKKECTINWAWTQMRIRRALEAESCESTALDASSPAKHPRSDSADTRFSTRPLSSDCHLDLANSIGGLHSSHYFTDGTLYGQIQSPAVLDTSYDPLSLHQPIEDDLSLAEWEAIFELSGDGKIPELPETGSLEAISGDPSPGSNFVGDLDLPGQMQGQLQWETDANSWLDTTCSPITATSFDAPTPPYNKTHARERKARKRRRTSQPTSPEYSVFLSSLAADHRLAASTNEGLISSNLLRIYHDVLEHNLSCWLTEVSCPYQPRSKSLRERVKLAEWGPSWSNRLYDRTLKLEEAAKKARLVQLSPSEDRACGRALHLAILAFATQWAQGSRRKHERYPPFSAPSEDVQNKDNLGRLTESFDSEVQWYFWTQAEKALHEMSDVESFRLVCAELILGLVQKPFDRNNEVSESMEAEENRQRRRHHESNDLMLEISKVIAQDGPRKYMERAARRMHTLKFKYDSAMKDTLQPSRADDAADPVLLMSEDDQTSVGLLYWLAVMFDTVSSSVHHRPLVVPDQECQHQDCADEDTDSPRWILDLFIQDQMDSPTQRTKWPCSYEALAEAVTKSGPVKVLLYRHVAWLQNSLRRGQKREKIEEIIHSAMTLHRYWNITYGRLFRELVRDFPLVPGRIQSWFVCISGHWHLAAMLLADLVETVDKQGLGSSEGWKQRLKGRTVATLRDTSAKELSDLARVATPSHVHGGGAFTEPQLPDFHPFVNEATILTDPWTIILIQAFSRAAVHLLARADDCREDALEATGGEGAAETVRRAEECVKGLWLLGKKSDVARRVADILWKGIHSQW